MLDFSKMSQSIEELKNSYEKTIKKQQDELNYINNIFKEYEIDGYDMLIEIVKSYKFEKDKSVKLNKIVDNTLSENPIQDENELKNNNIKNEMDRLKNTIKITEKTLPSPSASSEKTSDKIPDKIPEPSISHDAKKNNKFFNKSLPILERCNILAYDYNYDLHNDKTNEILQFLSSEHKVATKFNSIVADKIGKDDNIWKDIYNFKIKNKELKDSNSSKSNYKFKILRCKYLYNKYGENLNKFKIYSTYIGRLTYKEWDHFLIEFDKLYNDTFKDMEKCQHEYKDGKICGIYNCNIKHKENK